MSANHAAPLAYIGLGSNLGDRAGYLLLAVRGLLEAGLVVKRLSAIYATAPVGFAEQPEFLNQVASVHTANYTPEQVLARLLRIEYALGRRRSRPQGPRTIDLDLLFYGNTVRDTDLLTLPHPRLHQRRFVLEPLMELAPDLEHPLLGQTIREMRDTVTDTAPVRRWKADKS